MAVVETAAPLMEENGFIFSGQGLKEVAEYYIEDLTTM